MFSLQKNLQVTAGKVVRLRCESRGGNPPAGLKWFIDEEQLQGRVRLRLEILLRLFITKICVSFSNDERKVLFTKIETMDLIRGHSTTTWTKFDPNFGPQGH